MIKFLGICKLVFCFIVAIAFLIVLIQYKNLTRRDVIAFAIVLLVVAIYIYYISATAIWNLNAKVYKTNIFAPTWSIVTFCADSISGLRNDFGSWIKV